MNRIEITVDEKAFRDANWKLACEEVLLGSKCRPSAIWCADADQDCGLAVVDDNGCLRCFFSGPNVDVAEAVAFFQSCLLKGV